MENDRRRRSRNRANSVTSINTAISGLVGDELEESMVSGGSQFLAAIMNAGKGNVRPAGHIVFAIFATTMKLIQIAWMHKHELTRILDELDMKKTAFFQIAEKQYSVTETEPVKSAYLSAAEDFRLITKHLDIAMIELKASFKTELAGLVDRDERIERAREDQIFAATRMDESTDAGPSDVSMGTIGTLKRKRADATDTPAPSPKKVKIQAPVADTETPQRINETYGFLD